MPIEQRILRQHSIYVWVMPPFVGFLLLYVVLTRDNGLTVMPWALVVVGLMPVVATADILGARLVWSKIRLRGGVEHSLPLNALAFGWACAFAVALLLTTGGYRSPLWVFLLVPILGAGSGTSTMRGFVATRLILGAVLFSGYLPYLPALTLADWLNLLLI
ncbi:MAG: hypothetical protein KGJ86_21895, partial [Chloroflexota bacterium]|nr:hypothetical protein [Chloroflexota bacterium]